MRSLFQTLKKVSTHSYTLGYWNILTRLSGPGPVSHPFPEPVTFTKAELLAAYGAAYRKNIENANSLTTGGGSPYPKQWRGDPDNYVLEYPITKNGLWTGVNPGPYRLLYWGSGADAGKFYAVSVHSNTPTREGSTSDIILCSHHPLRNQQGGPSTRSTRGIGCQICTSGLQKRRGSAVATGPMCKPIKSTGQQKVKQNSAGTQQLGGQQPGKQQPALFHRSRVTRSMELISYITSIPANSQLTGGQQVGSKQPVSGQREGSKKLTLLLWSYTLLILYLAGSFPGAKKPATVQQVGAKILADAQKKAGSKQPVGSQQVGNKQAATAATNQQVKGQPLAGSKPAGGQQAGGQQSRRRGTGTASTDEQETEED